MTKHDEKECPLEETFAAPEILVDGYQSVVVVNGMAKFTCFSLSHDPIEGINKRRINLRLALPLPVCAAMSQTMGELIKTLQEESDAKRS